MRSLIFCCTHTVGNFCYQYALISRSRGFYRGNNLGFFSDIHMKARRPCHYSFILVGWLALLHHLGGHLTFFTTSTQDGREIHATQCKIYGITQIDRYSFNMFTIGYILSLLAYAEVCASINRIISCPCKRYLLHSKTIGYGKSRQGV